LSFQLSLAGLSPYATNNFGAFLSTQKLPFNQGFAPNFSKVKINNIITSGNWVKYFFSFVADSNYQHISFGNFFDSTNTSYQKIAVGNVSKVAYYYLDDICLSDDSIYTQNYKYNCTVTAVNENSINRQQIEIYPNPCDEYFYMMGVNDKTKFELGTTEGKIIKFGYIKEFEKININNLPESVYVLQLYTDKGVLRKKIIVKH
jgi:hypothetical protein